MRRGTKRTGISPATKRTVWERDGGRCVLCGTVHAAPCAHIIPRSLGGMGIETNIVTLCERCHREYDQGAERKRIRAILERYMRQHYPQWTEEENIYRKWR